jgi:hypothetical protein
MILHAIGRLTTIQSNTLQPGLRGNALFFLKCVFRELEGVYCCLGPGRIVTVAYEAQNGEERPILATFGSWEIRSEFCEMNGLDDKIPSD